MSFPSEPDMMSKKFQNADSIYVNLMTDVIKIIVKYHPEIIAKYRHLTPSENRALINIFNFWRCPAKGAALRKEAHNICKRRNTRNYKQR